LQHQIKAIKFMDCPRCKCTESCKAGTAKGRQRYKCKSCGYYYTVERKSDVKPEATRRMALEMYLEGIGFRGIGRLLGISFGTVYQWVKKWGKQIDLPVRGESVSIVELDELHSYVMQKKTTAGHGLLLIDLQNGLSLLSAATAPRQRG
jgi:transposase-like protein